MAVGTSIDLGTLFMPGKDAVGTFFFSDAKVWRDYTLTFDLDELTGVNGIKLELLDPMGGGDDPLDPGQPDWMPAGYSSSNNRDGLSFAQGSGLERSATFAGGSAMVTADEITHRGDILIMSGLSGADQARVVLGLRDSHGARGFLLRISAFGLDATAAPEPASMDDVIAKLGVDDYVNRRYVAGNALPISLYVGYYASQRQGDTIHSPQNCLPGAGWRPVVPDRTQIDAGGRVIPVNRCGGQ
jgi:hypothetical protein